MQYVRGEIQIWLLAGLHTLHIRAIAGKSLRKQTYGSLHPLLRTDWRRILD